MKIIDPFYYVDMTHNDLSQPYYQKLKDYSIFWTGKFIPSAGMVLNEMARRGWLRNDFKAKKQWRNK